MANQRLPNDKAARFSYIFVPELGTKLVYEYNIETRSSWRHEIAVPWAFSASCAFSQTPAGQLFVTGGIGDEQTMKRCYEVIPRDW